MPKSVSVLIEKPSSFIAANVPMSETGIVIAGISVLCQFCKKMKITRTTSRIAISSVTTNFLDRGADEVRSVEGDLIRVAGRHRLRDLRHRRAHVLRDLQRVGRRFAFDREHDGRLAVVARRRDVVLRAELDLGDVAQP